MTEKTSDEYFADCELRMKGPPEPPGKHNRPLDFKCGDANIERIFDLPRGAIEGFRSSGKMPPDAVALFRLVEACPWLLDVADSGFRDSAIKEHLLLEVEKIVKRRKNGQEINERL